MNSIIMKILLVISLMIYVLSVIFDWLGIGCHKPVPPAEVPSTAVTETTTSAPTESETELTTVPAETTTEAEPSTVLPETTSQEQTTHQPTTSTTVTEPTSAEPETEITTTEPVTEPTSTEPVTEPSTTAPVTEPSTTRPATTEPTTAQTTTETTQATTAPTTEATTVPTTAGTTGPTTEPTTKVEIGPQIRSAVQIGLDTYGGTGNDIFKDIDNTSDGGFVAVGTSSSKDEDMTKTYNTKWGEITYSFIVKYDKDGKVLWQKGESTATNAYELNGVAALNDGTIVAVGQIKGKDHTESAKAVIIKYSANGSRLWEKTFDGNKTDIFTCVDATGNGFVVGGTTDSTTSDFEGITVMDGNTVIIMNFDFDGNILWNKYVFGDNGSSIGGIAADSYNNVFVTCISSSTQGSFAHFEGFGKGYVDTAVIKYDYKGDYVWNYVIASTARDELGAVVANGDGGCTVAGYYEIINTYKPDGTLSGLHNYGGTDGLVIRIKPDGTKKWITTVAGSANDFIEDITLVGDGGYAIAGYTASSDRDFAKTEFAGEYDGFTGFVTPGGNKVDFKTAGGTKDDRTTCIAYSNREIVMALGRCASDDGPFEGVNAMNDLYFAIFGSYNYTGYITRYRVTLSKI